MNTLRYRKHFGLAALAALTGWFPAMAQQSAFQSADGQTSLYLDGGSAATLNFADTKFSIGHISRHSTRALFWGYQVYGAASSGTTTLFSSKIKVPEGGADFVVGWHPLTATNPNNNTDDWLLFDAGYSRSIFYAASAPEPIAQAKRYFDRFRTIVAYNRLVNKNFLFGIAAGAERRNNLSDLQQVTFETTLVPAPANTSTSIAKTQGGYLGAYREYIAAPIYTDMLFVLPQSITVPGFKSQIAFDAFTRSDLGASNRSADGGLGVFLTKPGAPTKVTGGVAGSWNGGRIKVALVASYNF
jgi:hypothetical protein